MQIKLSIATGKWIKVETSDECSKYYIHEFTYKTNDDVLIFEFYVKMQEYCKNLLIYFF